MLWKGPGDQQHALLLGGLSRSLFWIYENSIENGHKNCTCHIFFKYFFSLTLPKDIFSLLLEREEGREEGRESNIYVREISCGCPSYVLASTGPATWPCVLTGNPKQPFSCRTMLQPAEPHWPGHILIYVLFFFFKVYFILIQK